MQLHQMNLLTGARCHRHLSSGDYTWFLVCGNIPTVSDSESNQGSQSQGKCDCWKTK